MTASHGRAGRRGRSWLTTALAASGLCLAAPGARPTLACHIGHTKPKTTANESTATTTPPVAATSTSTQTPTQALQAFMKVWDEQTKAQPQVISPTPATSMPPTHEIHVDQFGRVSSSPTPAPVHTGAQTIVAGSPASTPSVENFHQSTATACMPPTPPSLSAISPTAATQGITAPVPLKAPAALTNPPTPAPEPSTILTAVALTGAFAWRRRATLRRA